MRRAIVAGALLLSATTAAACQPQGMLFRVDERLTITAPEDRSEVTLPFTLTWDIEDFEIQSPGGEPPTSQAGYFAVFLDRSPVAPGARVVEARDVFTTTRTSLRIENVPRSDEQHTATIVLVDTAGNRIGESAFGVTFEVVASDEGQR